MAFTCYKLCGESNSNSNSNSLWAINNKVNIQFNAIQFVVSAPTELCQNLVTSVKNNKTQTANQRETIKTNREIKENTETRIEIK